MPDLTPEAWARIRYEYEHTDRPVEEICAEHGISSGTLRDRMRRWRWRRRRPPIPAEGPPAVLVPRMETSATPLARFTSPDWGEAGSPSARLGASSTRYGDPGEGEQTIETRSPPHPDPLAAGEREQAELGASVSNDDNHAAVVLHTAAGHERTAPDSEPASIGARLQSAVAHVLPALETTLARLAGGPMQPRHMEQVARALGSLTRTLRELNGLLAQHSTHEDTVDSVDTEELRRSIARSVQALAAQEREARPRRYVAAWNEFAEAQAANPSP